MEGDLISIYFCARIEDPEIHVDNLYGRVIGLREMQSIICLINLG